MSSAAAVCRVSTWTASRSLRNRGSSRYFGTSASNLAASNFTMPAMSPTMTEGNISSWKVKEGDSFSAGDILLEIETDKAQMDVEAQDDGVIAKILQSDGSKSVKVGSRIAVLAEPGDNLESLELPPDDSSKPASSDKGQQESTPSKPREPSQESSNAPSSESSSSKASGIKDIPGKTQKQTYPLYPSVQHLLHEKGLSKDDANSIPASGPNGRLLKGDVLAYLGKIDKSHPSALSDRLSKLGHLDLSNIKLAAPKDKPTPKENATAPPEPVPELPVHVSLPVSFAAVLATQKRVQESLGILLPLSTFIARATDLANDDLPRSKTAVPSRDELFNEVLGIKEEQRSRGTFNPIVSTLPSVGTARGMRLASKKVDIFDILTGTPAVKKAPVAVGLSGVGGATNVFSVATQKGDERRARVFLERMKTALEAEPGRLVL
ncbi:hypothetical protein M501DRAFT_1006436 [Patellaria atrata CBS 101060]|uniref:Pyruvate dehydrogenase protein x component n=1 Tax=Patellaria atrata CBS 101060 TaxID=1346257 RepID=A0A9P4S8B1_9PEZI|nr:hypothetical protein M501DRAFT_1006436 [Patellaria atrata CBS 101060]